MATVPQFPTGTLSRSALNTFVTEVTTNITDANIAASAAISASKLVIGTYTAPTTWVPTFTASSGTPTTVTLGVARYTQIGKMVHLNLSATITDKGSASASLLFTLPVTAQSSAIYHGSGTETNTTGKMLQVQPSSTTVAGVLIYDTGTVWVNGYIIKLSLTYEAA